MAQKSALGRGLSSLIPQKETITEQVLPEAKGEVMEIPVSQVAPNPRQPRREFAAEHLEDLAASIKEHGVMQPLVVTKSGDGYELIAGERRLRASKEAGLETVPAIVRDASEQQKLELALIENIQRHDLNPVEEAIAYKALIEEFNLTQDQMAKRVGKSRSVIANALRLLELSDEILDALGSGKITKSHARTLLAEPDAKKRDALFHGMLKGGVSVREAEGRVAKGTKGAKGAKGATDPNMAEHEKRLREALGHKVRIQDKKGKGKIVIEYNSRDDLKNLLADLTDL